MRTRGSGSTRSWSVGRPGLRLCRSLKQALRAEYAHALYLSLPTFVVPAPSLQNRSQLPSYARTIANLLQMGGTSAFTQIAVRIPVSDPAELIGQGPAPAPAINGGPTGLAPSGSAGTGNAHKRISSLSTRPPSVHQSALPLNMRVTSAASSTMSARSAGGGGLTGDPSSTWEMWDTIRTMCGYHPRLSLSTLANLAHIHQLTGKCST